MQLLLDWPENSTYGKIEWHFSKHTIVKLYLFQAIGIQSLVYKKHTHQQSCTPILVIILTSKVAAIVFTSFLGSSTAASEAYTYCLAHALLRCLPRVGPFGIWYNLGLVKSILRVWVYYTRCRTHLHSRLLCSSTRAYPQDHTAMAMN